MLTRLLPASRGGGSVIVPAHQNLAGLINGCTDATYAYKIGWITSSDGGSTWSVSGASTLDPGTGWESTYVKDPYPVWDGSQFVVFYCGTNGSNMGIGRATCSSLTGTITKYGSNPILTHGAGGSFDETNVAFPTVLYEPALSPPWRMWYDAATSGGTRTVGYADSTDGLSWTKRGKVLDVGTAGQFDESGAELGAVFKSGSTYYLYYGGFNADGFRHSAYATFTDPLGTYTKQGKITGFDTLLTVGAWSWRSNKVRCVLPYGTSYRLLIDFWNPGGATGAPTDTEEGCATITSASLTSFSVPGSLMLSLGSGWDANSAENPVAVLV